jgi:hypothetical protein
MNGAITVAAAASCTLGLLVTQSQMSTALIGIGVGLAGLNILRWFASIGDNDPWRTIRREGRAARAARAARDARADRAARG